MLKLFLTIVPSSIEQMQTALNKSNMEELKAVVHKLKPSINNLRIPLTNQIKTIEVIDMEQGVNSNIQKVVSEIIETLELCMNEIKENEGF
jgi:HPt (histidine-containing phosphotransfer) domain-containing protein